MQNGAVVTILESALTDCVSSTNTVMRVVTLLYEWLHDTMFPFNNVIHSIVFLRFNRIMWTHIMICQRNPEGKLCSTYKSKRGQLVV